MKSRIFLTAITAVLLAACSKSPPETAAVEPIDSVDPATHGAELLAPFKSNLMRALSEGMQEGPAVAIEICSEQAPGIARLLSVDGVRMGRSSHKLRNPDNAPPEWLEPVIAGYASGTEEMQPRTVALGEGRTGYAEPIIVQPMCLACHGNELAPEVAEQIATLYPEDQATGFSAGDFRGVFWVEF